VIHPELLKTKIFIPILKPTVKRNKLFSLLDDGLQNRLTLVSAPAGFGKSTLIADWIQLTQESDKPGNTPAFTPAWLSLDEGDSDKRRFLTYFTAALQSADENLGCGVSAALEAADDINIENLLTILINEITNLPLDIVLVLDDYHLIESPSVDHTLSFFLDYLPSNMHLIISSRINPSFNLSRLRASGQMTEIRAADLRFSQTETAEFLNRAAGIELPESKVKALEARTEGWVAGLQFAALSMRGTDDIDKFVESFTGSNRYIIDYLGEEVLSGLSVEIRDFLLNTSILTRLNGSLCDALIGDSGGEAILEDLERRNLFIIPLDNDRRWFRYHHLFSDLLKRRLEYAQPETASRLHHRAGLWHLEKGDFTEAFRHFMESGDPAKAVEILEGRWHVFIHRGQAGQLQRMLDSLEPAEIKNSAPLSMARCWLYCIEENFDPIPIHLKSIYKALDDAPLQGLDVSGMKLAVIPSLAETMEAVVNFENNRPGETKKHAQKAITLIPKEALPATQGLLYASASYWLALAYEELGETDQACTLHLELIELMKMSENQMGAANSLLEISRIYLHTGRLDELIRLCEDMLAYISERGWDRLPPTGVSMLVLSKALRLSGSIVKADKYFTAGQELIRPIMSPRFRELMVYEVPGQTKQASGSFLIEALSLRELEVLNLVARGLSNSEICDHLFLALSTVKGHNRNIFDKLQVKSRTEAAVRARELGLIQ